MLILIHTKFNNGQFIHTISSDKIYTDSSQLALAFVITNNQIKHALKKYLVKNNINPIQSENSWSGRLNISLNIQKSFTQIISQFIITVIHHNTHSTIHEIVYHNIYH